MANFNKIILVGNLTKDPVLSYLPSQTAVVETGIAVNRKWKDQSGTEKTEVCFVDLKAFGKPAETINKFCKKGASLLVEGRLSFETWQGKDGAKHSKHRVIIENFQFIGGKAETNGTTTNDMPEPPQTGGEDIPF